MANRKESFEICLVGSYEGDPPEGALRVNADQDYVLACQAIRDPGTCPTGLWVSSRPLFAWLQHYCRLIELHCRFRELTPRLILSDRWGVSLPDWLDDETVVSEKLLSVDMLPGSADNVVDALLGHFLGRIFQASELAPERLVEALTAVVDPQSRELFAQYPVLRRSFEEKCDRWEERATFSWEKECCRTLKADPEALWHDLTLWALLSRYPDRLIEFVAAPQRVVFLRAIPVRRLTELPLHPGAVEDAREQLEVFFRDIDGTVSSSADFHKVLEAVSGRLPQEFASIEKLLESSPCDLRPADIERVRQAFKTCPGVSALSIDSLERFMPPVRPSMPDAGQAWGVDQWLRWALEEYLPYRHWQIHNKRYDEQVERAVGAFSDWYIAEYAAIHQDVESSLVHLLTQWREPLMEDELSLILLIDCLPVSFWSLWEAQMTALGFHRQRQEYRFAPLPSHTESCKPWLLSGAWERVNRDYGELLQERARRDWPDKAVQYFPNLKALAQVDTPENPAILVLNFLQVDRTLHTDVEADGSTYREELVRLFARLGEAVKEIFGRWRGDNERFGVYVVTDHGATRTLEEERTSLDSQVVSRLFPDEKCRFAWITPDNAASIPENLWTFGYQFEPPFGNQEERFFIPRGHHTVRKGGSATGFVHGGASPEEVIVPAAVFRPVSAAWKEPAIRFINLRLDRVTDAAVFYIMRVVAVQLEIQNPNAEELRIVRMDVLDPKADVKQFTTGRIGPQETGMLELSCYFRKAAQDQEELRLQITYELAGEEHTIKALTRAAFKSATTGGFSLRALE